MEVVGTTDDVMPRVRAWVKVRLKVRLNVQPTNSLAHQTTKPVHLTSLFLVAAVAIAMGSFSLLLLARTNRDTQKL